MWNEGGDRQRISQERKGSSCGKKAMVTYCGISVIVEICKRLFLKQQFLSIVSQTLGKVMPQQSVANGGVL